MTEQPIMISNLNDFIFCPVSIYFHMIEEDIEKLTYQDHYQINGTAAHEKPDKGMYSTKTTVLQALPVYCQKYNIMGKIDTFDTEKGILTERKKMIRTVYDGYVFQIYAQYFALAEMSYRVCELRLYSIDDNKIYNIKKPEEDPQMLEKFEETIKGITTFKVKDFSQTNIQKCRNCIYESLCSFSTIKGE